MKMLNFTFRRFTSVFNSIFAVLFLSFTFSTLHAQQEVVLKEMAPTLEPTDYLELPFNLQNFQAQLKDAPKNGTNRASSIPLELSLPMPNGSTKNYWVEITDPIAPDLVETRPDFKTYNLFDAEADIFAGRLFVSSFGVSALIFTEHGVVSIKPLDMNNPVMHKVAFDRDVHHHDCELGEEELASYVKPTSLARSSFLPNGANKRTYRFAIVTTGEFYEHYGTMAAADAAVTMAVNDINAIYLRELATEFTVVGPVHYTDPDTDPFYPDQSNGVSRTAQAAAVIGENWTTGQYDMGHVLHHMTSGGSGVAGLGVVCRNISNPIPSPTSGYSYSTGGVWKGRGWSGGNAGASWFAGLFGHEVGHMFNAPHTFNGTGGSCTSNIASNFSYEIASGSTIMSYQGSCSSGQNIPSSGLADNYFHGKTLENMLAYMNGTGNCNTSEASGNMPPNVNANNCGGTYTVPKLTPFSLTGTGSDPDGDQVYYCWEQIDEDGSGTPTQGFIGTTAGNSAIAPLFRSYPPNTNPKRNFPVLSTILNNANISDFEPLPNAARTLNFRLTGRDFQTNGGLSCSDVAVTVDGSSGPLEVTSPNGGENWSAGSQTVTWNVNNTNTVSATVDILMSIDGGQSFPIELATGTNNDGSATVTIPSVSGVTNARMKVRAKVNDCFEFFDLSDGDFSFTSNCAAEGSVVCPTTSVDLPSGDPGLNLTMSNHFGGEVTQNTFNINGASPTGPLANATTSGGGTCQTPWGTERYDEFDFVVNTTGTYNFSNTSGGQIIYSVFESNGYNPASPCAGTFIGSNATGAISWSSAASMTLSECTKYKLVVWTLFSASATPTITISGAGTVYESGAGPGANYSYTFAAVNTADGEVDAFSATADFTGLSAGSYEVYGMNYKTGGPTPPANVNPTNLVGMTISAILGAGNCVNFSANSRPMTITGTVCPTVTDVFINEFHYDDDGADENEFVEVAKLNTASFDLADVTLTLYNGADGTSYGTHTLDGFTEGANDGTYTYYHKDISGIQDGAPDGLALSCGGSSIEFLSYEGTFTATNGDANGESSTDVGVSETSTSPSGTSIQKVSGTWYVTCGQNTKGAANVLPTLSLAATNAVQDEGNSGTTAFTFTVTRGGLTSGATDVDYAVTGTGGDPADATDFGGSLPSGTVSFAASETSKVITINVSGDTDAEPDETFTVTISNPTGCAANITTATAEGTIQNDDCTPQTWYRDMDVDGYGDAGNTTSACTQPAGYVLDNTDCDDNDMNEFPGQTWYLDGDGDDYSDGTSTMQCERPTNYFTAGELTETSGDCDDSDANVNPGATEVCNGIDDNCDGNIDEGVLTTYYQDSDDDGYGNPAVAQDACSQPVGYVADNTDCDDTDANEFPGQTWYLDGDGDGYSDGTSLTQCERPANYFTAGELTDTSGDCDDSNSAVNPGATEVCNGIDDNCDGNIDEGVLTTYYQDSDDDGYGNPAASQMACSQPMGYVTDNMDCDDTDGDEYPGQTWYLDGDGDGYSDGTSAVQCERPANYFTAGELTATSGDCDDADANVNPGATEVCNGIDDNCDSNIDEGVLTTYYQDSDDDGFGNPAVTQDACSQPVGYVTDNTDCDDTDANEYPGQMWYLDGDGDGYSDGTSATQCERPANYFTAGELTDTSGDCDDSNAAVNPGATEICNGIDDDCDGDIDETGLTTYYQDSDDDGFGNPAVSQDACTQPVGYVLDNTDCDDTDANEYPGQTWYLDGDGDGYSDGTSLTQCERPANYFTSGELTDTSGDCDDSNAAVNPAATEICNGIDDNCDGNIDEGVLTTYYQDSDDDGFGNPSASQMACSQPMGYVLDNTDCDDTDANEYPGQTWYLDGDGDGYSDGTTLTQCERPANYFTAGELTDTSGDCDDSNAAVNPAATEVCNGIDDDCDGDIDETGGPATWYADTDGDGYGDPPDTQVSCVQPAGYVMNSDDCDDTDGNVNPDAIEVCNGIDDNCDGNIDEGVQTTYYQDSDGDGYGNTAVSEMACSQPMGYVADNTDCDDTDEDEYPGQMWYLDGDGDGYSDGTSLTQCERPANYFTAGELTATSGDCDDSNSAVNPGATEICNGIDDDCDGDIDETGGPATWYADTDSDGYGDPAVTQVSCVHPAGYVMNSDDCDDTDGNVNPDAIEVCNGIDDNCDGNIDEGVLTTYYQDSDGDGYGNAAASEMACSQPAGYVANSDDCDDTDGNVNPDAVEVCNGIDDNCDGNIDEGVLTTYYQDLDDDGFGNPAVTQDACSQPVGYVTDNTDCDDTDANEYPGQTWYLDGDGDGYSDGTSATQCERPIDYFTAGELTDTSGDCDDSNAAVNPGATEVCNGIDDDCDGDIDETGGPATWYADADSDGYGDPADTQVSCVQPAGYVMNSDDCDDTDGNVNPDAIEVCNGIDDNCDGNIDEGVLMTYYQDADDDGYGNPAAPQMACSQPVGYVLDNTDCDDTDGNEYPGQTWYLDGDGDGYSDGTSTTQCERPVNYFTAGELTDTSGDCDDSNAAVNPAATEVCNGIDDNCDGNTDEGVLMTFYQDADDDGYGNPAASQMACSQPVGYVLDNTDCDDTDGDEYPGQMWYLDGDGDGYSDGTSTMQCERPANYFTAGELTDTSGDCDDSNAAVNPGATEVCNGIDDNCDGDIDEGVLTTYYQDADDDGFGNPAVTQDACSQPMGYVLDNTDCDDSDADEYPGQTWYLDGDGDGYSDGTSQTQCERPANHFTAGELTDTSGDCDDSNAAVNPGATEVCNGIDDNCDGDIDEVCCSISGIMLSNVSACDNAGTIPAAGDDIFTADVTVFFDTPATTGTLDLTGDGTASVAVGALDGPTSHTFVNVIMSADGGAIALTAAFSDDAMCTFSEVNAGTAPEPCSDPCTITIDDVSVAHETCPGIADGTITVMATSPNAGQIGYSIDGGVNFNFTGIFTALTPGTYNIVVKLFASPSCEATTTVTVNAAPASALQTWYKDIDGDGYSDGNTLVSCDQPTGYKLAGDLIATSGDCNDFDPNEYPGQVFYLDADGDGYSDGTSVTACQQPANHYPASELTATSGDCDDSDNTIHPGAAEICDGLDNDCDGEIDEGAAGGLTWTGNITFTNQAQVDNFSQCYSVIDGHLTIKNAGVTDLSNLVNLVEVTKTVKIQSTGLASLSGLDNLETIGQTLTVKFNHSLTTLDGLQGVTSVGNSLQVFRNNILTDCCPIHDLINNGGVGGAITIMRNDTGCDDVSEINTACVGWSPLIVVGGGVQNAIGAEAEDFKEMSLFPNPAKEEVNIQILAQYEQGMLRVFDQMGKTVLLEKLPEDAPEHLVQVGKWDAGVYFVRLELDGEILTQKLIVR